MTATHTAWTLVPVGTRPAVGRIHRVVLGETEIHFSTGKLGADRIARGGQTVQLAGRLGLITQVGSSFQTEHPEVPILLDRGRHLLVDLESTGGQASVTNSSQPVTEDSCWKIESLTRDTTVVQSVSPRRTVEDVLVNQLLGELSSIAVQTDLLTLVGFGTRHSLRPGFTAACAFAVGRLTSLGYQTTSPAITVNGGTSQNVVAERMGSGPTNRTLVLVTAHLDSINIAGGPNAPAPGADDNGSGAVALLELARVLSGHSWKQDLRLILFGGEEEGLHGSRQYVAALAAAERSRISAVVNMDMVGTRNTADLRVLLEGATLSQPQIDDLATAAATYTRLTTEVSLNPFASDHVPFIQAGIPAVLTIEGTDSANSHIHSAADVMAHIDLEFLLEILKMNLAALTGWLGRRALPKQAGSVLASESGTLEIFLVGPDSVLYQQSFRSAGWQAITDLGGVPVSS